MAHIRRTFFVLIAGVVMALAAYAGQSGYPDERLIRLAGDFTEIRRLELKGVRVVYSLGRTEKVTHQGEKNRSHYFQSTLSEVELALALIDLSTGEPIHGASVYLTVSTPRGSVIQARGKEKAGGYLTTLDDLSEGRYQIDLAAEVHGEFLQDRFCYDTL